MNINASIRLTDDLERQLLAVALEEQSQIHPMRFVNRLTNALIDMSKDLVAARAKCTETQLV